MEIHQLPVISTAHLCEHTVKVLSEMGNSNPWCPCSAWEFGYFISVDDLTARESDCIPWCLTDIRNWLLSQQLKCTSSTGEVSRAAWVRLDRDADQVEGLPVYDW